MSHSRRLILLLPTLLLALVVRADDATTTTNTTPAPGPSAAPDTSISSLSSLQAIDPAKVVEINKLLERTGTLARMNAIEGQMMDMFKKQMPNVPPDFWDKFSHEIDNRELLNQIIPLYDKYYTLDDLKAINAFYDTPTGQKMLTTTPQIMQESMAIGQAWGQKVGMKVEEELAKERQDQQPNTPSPKPPSN